MIDDEIFKIAKVVENSLPFVKYQFEDERGYYIREINLAPFKGTEGEFIKGLYFGKGYPQPEGFLRIGGSRKFYRDPCIFTSIHPKERADIIRNREFHPSFAPHLPDTFCGIPIFFGRYSDDHSAVAFGNLKSALTVFHKDFQRDTYGYISGSFAVLADRSEFEVVEHIEELKL